MYWLVGLMSFAILGLILGGLVLEFRPALAGRMRPWYRPAMAWSWNFAPPSPAACGPGTGPPWALNS